MSIFRAVGPGHPGRPGEQFVAPELREVQSFRASHPTCQRCRSKPTETVVHRGADDKHVALCRGCYEAFERPSSSASAVDAEAVARAWRARNMAERVRRLGL